MEGVMTINCFLKNLELFRDLDEYELNAVALIAKKTVFKPGETLFRQGEPAEDLYIIEKGTILLSVRLPGDRTIQLAQVGPGDMLGEIYLLDKGTRTATAIAQDLVHCYKIPNESSKIIYTYSLHATIKIMRRLTKWLCKKVRLNDASLMSFGETMPDKMIYARTRYSTKPFLRRISSSGISEDIIKRLAFFENLTEKNIHSLLQEMTYWQAKKGDLLFRQGDKGNSMFVVIRGAVKIVLEHEKHEDRLAILGPGTAFGHVALIDGGKRTASAIIKENAILFELSKETYNKLIGKKDLFAYELQKKINASLLRLLQGSCKQIARIATEKAMAGEAAKSMIGIIM